MNAVWKMLVAFAAGALGMTFLGAGLVTCACSCTPASSPETTYAAEQAACVSAATTLAESRACRARVDERWGVRDAGRE